MQVNVGRLKGQRGSSLDASFRVVEVPGLDWGDDARLVSPVNVEVTVSNTGQCMLVRGTITALLEVQCSRCLKPFQWELEAPLEEEFFLADGAHRKQDGQAFLTEEEEQFAETSTFFGEIIDLTEAVREQTALGLPLKHLCNEDCPGLCSKCGAHLADGDCGCDRSSIDPRLAELARLLKDEDEDGSSQ